MQVRKLGFAALIAGSTALAAFGCKKETFQTPGANQEELNREGQQTAHDYSDDKDHTFGKPGATPEEVSKEQSNAADEPEKKSTTFSTPGESLGEAKGKGLVPGQGGGPQDDTARPSNKTAPPSTEKKDHDSTWSTPGATEKEVTDEDSKTSPLGTGR
jgi:hypothetical protein